MGPVSEKIAATKAGVVRDLLAAIETLPLSSADAFLADPRMVAAGESFLRRALEALLDLGRHILAKGFGAPTAEYREIGARLGDHGVLSGRTRDLLVEMGGYRNRLTHFYNEVTPEELHLLLTTRIDDIDTVLEDMLDWMRTHPSMIDRSL